MKIHFVYSNPKQYLFNKIITLSGINIVHNKELDAFKNCLLKKNSEKSVDEFFEVLNETPVNKKYSGLINLEVIDHFNGNKKNLAPEWIRCAIWRSDDDCGTFFDVILKKFGKKNKKREHYTDMRKICTQIIDECKKFADGYYDSGLHEAKKVLSNLLTKGPRCE